MKTCRVLAVAAALALLAGPAWAQDDQDRAWFSEKQAGEGRVVFNAHCAACHGMSVLDIFVTYPDAAAFYNFISGSMPRHAPGSLSDEEYVDILAFIMDGVGFPAGEDDLPPDRTILSRIHPALAPHTDRTD